MKERDTSPEREAEIRAQHAARSCSYVGRCNSTRCPLHGPEARAMADLLAMLGEARARGLEDAAYLSSSVADANVFRAQAERVRIEPLPPRLPADYNAGGE